MTGRWSGAATSCEQKPIHYFVVATKKKGGSVAPCWCTSSNLHARAYMPTKSTACKIMVLDHPNRMEHSCHVSLPVVYETRLKLHPPSRKEKQKIASGETDKNCFYPHNANYFCVTANKLMVLPSIYITVQSTLKPQHQHRKKLNPSIADDIIKLLNKITVPVEERLLSRMGLYNKITLWSSAHVGGCLLYPNRPRQKSSLGYISIYYFKIYSFPQHCNFLKST